MSNNNEEVDTTKILKRTHERLNIKRDKKTGLPKTSIRTDADYNSNGYIPASTPSGQFHTQADTGLISKLGKNSKRAVISTIIISLVIVIAVSVAAFFFANDAISIYKSDYESNVSRAAVKADKQAATYEDDVTKLNNDSSSIKSSESPSIDDLKNTIQAYYDLRDKINNDRATVNAVSGEDSDKRAALLKELDSEIDYYKGKLLDVLKSQNYAITYDSSLFDDNGNLIDNPTLSTSKSYSDLLSQCSSLVSSIQSCYNYLNQDDANSLLDSISDKTSHLNTLYTAALTQETTKSVTDQLNKDYNTKIENEKNSAVDDAVKKNTEELTKQYEDKINSLNSQIESLNNQINQLKSQNSSTSTNNGASTSATTNASSNGQNSSD